MTQWILSLLPTAYVVRRKGNVFTCVCPSIHPSVCPQGGTPARSSWQGGTPARSSQGGTPTRGSAWGTPSQVRMGDIPAKGCLPGVPPAKSGWEYPSWGHLPGVPPSPGQDGIPQPGGDHTGYPPSQVGIGDTPARRAPTQGTPHQVRMGVPQPGSACLGYPQPGQDGSTPARGHLPGVPPARSGQGYSSHGCLPGVPPS